MEKIPTPQYADDGTTFSVTPAGGPTPIVVHFTCGKVTVRVDLTILGGQRLQAALGSALTVAISRGTGKG